jgi:GntR family transcriptional repressor for pyruvate dehydrogenase complex
MFSPLSRRSTLSSEIAERITREIENGRLGPGQRLPTEQEFTAGFRVSRATIREAVSILRSQGLIVTKQGLGAFVADSPACRPFRVDPHDLESIKGMLQIVELRTGVEVHAAAMAAQRRQPADLQRMVSLLDRVDAAIQRKESAADLDFEFHRAIADATGNPYFRRFLDALGAAVIPRRTMSLGLLRPGADPRVYLRQIQAEHRAIYAAIEAKDPAAARKAAQVHLDRGRERYREHRDSHHIWPSIESKPARSAGS